MQRILLIEDDPLLIKMYSSKFELDGFNVDTALDGTEGLEKAKALVPDVILMDIMMPKMNGFEVLEQIKQIDHLKKVPVILLTNFGTDEGVKKGLALGAVDYIVKVQTDPAEVVAKVKKTLNSSHKANG